METPGVLIVLRGNSGSGKSTVAQLVQQQMPAGRCLLVPQDEVRRAMLREPDVARAGNIELLEVIGGWGLARGLVVIVEGILNAGRYQRSLERLGEASREAHFLAWDLPFEETVRRHRQRPKRGQFTEAEMHRWYHGWQPLDFTVEIRFDSSVSAAAAADEIMQRVRGGSP